MSVLGLLLLAQFIKAECENRIGPWISWIQRTRSLSGFDCHIGAVTLVLNESQARPQLGHFWLKLDCLKNERLRADKVSFVRCRFDSIDEFGQSAVSIRYRITLG